MGSIVADTHAVIYVASISVVEMIYLTEKGRLPEIALQRLSHALADPTTSLSIVPLDWAIAQRVRQISRDLLPDMPDRIIAATALHLNLPLVTCDYRIPAIGVKTIW